MSKMENLLVILQLLSSRRSLSIRTIQRECRVTERTAYRYVNSLAAAGFPIHYDREVGGYRILTKHSIIQQLTSAELGAIHVGALLLEQIAGERSLQAVKGARIKIESMMASKLQEVLFMGKQTFFNSKTPTALKEYVAFTLLLFASKVDSKVKIRFLNTYGELEEIDIGRPRILYDSGWTVSEGASMPEHCRIPIRSIQEIDIISSGNEPVLRGA